MVYLGKRNASRKHLCTKVTSVLHVSYSKIGGNLGLVLNDKKGNFSIKSYVKQLWRSIRIASEAILIDSHNI